MGVDAGGYAKCYAGAIDKGANLMGGLMVLTGIMAIVLVLSGLFHSVLRRLGQPSVISHILAGIVVGPTFLGRAVDLRELGMKDPGRELGGAIRYLRVLFMFFIGIEMDLRYLRRNLRRSLAIASGGFSLSFVFAMLGGTYFYSLMHPGKFPFDPDKLRDSTALFALVLTSTASPVLIRIVTELKLTGSEIGQLAIGAAFANDMASLAALSFVRVRSYVFGDALPTPALRALVLAAIALTLCATTSIAWWAARLLNRLNRGRRHVSIYELCGLLLLVTSLAEVLRVVQYSNVIGGFLMGLAVPREGPTARTIVDRLAYPMHQLIMPLCFAAIGARLDFARVELFFTAWRLARAVGFATLLSAVGNVVGTVVAGRAMGLAPGEAVVLGFLLNVKGCADVLAMNYADRVGVWGETEQAVLLLSSIVNTFMAGPASAAIVRKQREALQYQSRCLQDLAVVVTAAADEHHCPDEELSVLVCVHGAAGVHSMLAVAELAGAGSVHLLHLVELAAASKYTITHQLFHHHARGHHRYKKDYDEDEDDDWGNAREIDQVAAAVAAFTEYDGAAAVRQSTAISSLASMDADVRNGAEDARASLVVVPYHKDLRYDGRMVCRREGRRALNQRVLQRAPPPCTVGVLAERRRLLGGEDITEVAALFRGGPDDREAAAYAVRAAAHPMASVTVCRFRFPMVVEDQDVEEAVADEEFVADLHARVVATGRVAYTERHVRDGKEMVEALGAMAATYSLIVFGRTGGAGAGAEAVTGDMGGGYSGEEFLELGPVGEVLASDDFRGGASVLVLQQHSKHKTKITKQEQPPQQSTPPCPC